MFEMSTAVLTCIIYMAALFVIATWGEHARRQGKPVGANPWVYSLSLGVFCTTWTFYGSVGYAANSGFLFLALYLGATLSSILWWIILRRLVRLKDRFHLTSIADLISARYGKSRVIAGLVTLICVIGITPYVALQFRAVTASAAIITGIDFGTQELYVENRFSPVFAVLMILFTIVFGLRRINPTERHPGMMMALSVESIVKLIAFLVGGSYITLLFFGGFENAFESATSKISLQPFTGRGSGPELMQWITYMLLGFSSMLVLPRQFHVAVVENSEERHIRTAMWVFPLYLLVINFFVMPLAAAGLTFGFSASEGDTFFIKLLADKKWLSMLVFLGGFSAAASMVMVETVAIATMVVNHIVLPLSGIIRGLGGLRRYLLQCRWVAAAFFILGGFLYERLVSHEQVLISIGIISFAAVLQFAPALLIGLFWRQANKYGALLGLTGGFAVWAYTLGAPALLGVPWAGDGPRLLTEGLFGLSFLRPGQLFGLDNLDLVTHSVFWSMVTNITLFALGSILVRSSPEDEDTAEQFVGAMIGPVIQKSGLLPAKILTLPKRKQIETLFGKYFDAQTAAVLTRSCFQKSSTEGKERISILELAELQAEAERTLAAAIGTATAHAAIRAENIISEEESKTLSGQYAAILTEMKVSPAELRTRIDYYRERERILSRQARTFRLLSEVSQKLSASIEYDATLQSIARVPLPAIAECALLYVSEEPLPGEEPEPHWVVAHVKPELEEQLRARIQAAKPAPSAFTHVARALDSRKTITAAPDTIFRWNMELFQGVQVASSITLPLIARNTLFGTLTLFSSRPQVLQFSDEIAAVEELTYRCAIALDNARLYRNAQAAIRAREDFVSIASHELRTPLTPLRNQIQLIQKILKQGDLEQYPREKLDKLLESADRQVDRITRLISELLDISRARMGRLQLQLEEFDLNELARETAERYREMLDGAGCELKLITPEEAVRGKWDRLRVEEVVSNLLTNATKYASGKPVELRISREPNQARISVRDFGPGIDSKDQDRIFDRFERVVTPKRVGGFGLGLYISREIAAAHGGTLSVRSEPGEGAEFILTLPAAPTAERTP